MHKFRPLDSGFSELKCNKYKDLEPNFIRWEVFGDYNIEEGKVKNYSGKHTHPE